MHSPQTIINRVQSPNVPCSVVRLPTAAGARVRPIGVNPPGVKRIIVRAVVPQPAGGGGRINIPMSGQMVNIAGSTAGVQCLPGNIRVIRIPMSAASKMVTLPASAKSGGKIIVPASSISRQQMIGTGTPKIVTFGSPSNNAATNRVVPVKFSNAVVPSSKGDVTQVLLPQGHVATSQDVTMTTRQPITVVTEGSNMSRLVHLVSGSATGAALSSTDVMTKTVGIAKSTVIRPAAPKVIQRVVQVPSIHQDHVAARTIQQCSESTVPSTGVGGNTMLAVGRIATPVATTTTNAMAVVAGSTAPEIGRSVSTSDSLSTVHVTACSTTTVSNVTCPGVTRADVNPASTDVAPVAVVTTSDSVVSSESTATNGDINGEKPIEVCRRSMPCYACL